MELGECLACKKEFYKGNPRQLVCGDCRLMTNTKFKNRFKKTKGDIINDSKNKSTVVH